MFFCFFFFKQKTAYEMRISDWSSDVCSSDLYTPKESPDYPRVIESVQWVFRRCMEELAKRRNEPQRDDLLSYFAHEKFADRYLTDEEVLSYCTNIITGGVDTTTALTSHALAYLDRKSTRLHSSH